MAQERFDTDAHGGCEPAAPRLLQLRPDRRLGHEWDDWDGQPLPHDGIYRESSRLFFALVLAGLGGAALAGAAVIWLVAPRLGSLWPPLPTLIWSAFGLGVSAVAGWLAALALALRTGRNFLPPRLAERGLLARVMPMTERIGRRFGISRDRAGNAALRVYNALSAARARPGVRPDQLLVLLPRCLDKASMQGAMDVSARYGVPLFVAARGRYAREMISRVRPKAVVAVACERDLVSGIHDVARKMPVLGTTLGLPEGPCKNTSADLVSLERQIRAFLGIDARAG
ncbi:MAG TPA: DUF116 domain-containing protein [Longimicrobiales bacterium]